VFFKTTVSNTLATSSAFRRALQTFQQFLNFYEVDRIFFAVKQGGDGLLGHLVGFVFQTVDLDAWLRISPFFCMRETACCNAGIAAG